jgi:hypothetical protein
MTMHLTKEQSQFVQQQGEGPVPVLDPITNKTYVLLATEAFQQVRNLLPPAEAVPAGETAGTSPAAPPAEVKPLRQRLRDLPVPPEVATAVKKRCKELGLWWSWGSLRREILEERLLQWYYGGQYVGYLATAEGRIIVAAGLPDEAFDRQLAFLDAGERRNVILRAVDPWDDTRTIILSLGLFP